MRGRSWMEREIVDGEGDRGWREIERLHPYFATS